MGIGKGSQEVQAGGTTRTVGLPEYADPYFRRLLKGAEEATQPFYPDDPDTYGDLAGESTYVPYGGERIAGSSDYGDINTSRAMVRGIAENPIGGLTDATSLQKRGIAGLEGLAQYDPASYQARQFTSEEAQNYMDPYMQNVVDVQKRRAIEDFGRGQADRDAAAVGAGAFGGSRQAVMQGMAQEGLADRLGDIQATGSQAAFGQAMQAFDADRAAQRDAATFGEASRQFGAGQGLAGYQAALGAGRGLVDYGERERAADIQGAQLLETVGRDIRGEDQAGLDIAYQDFLRQQDYPMRQYERYAGLLSGVPVQPDISTATYQAYNPLQQALGTGISALGLYKGLT